MHLVVEMISEKRCGSEQRNIDERDFRCFNCSQNMSNRIRARSNFFSSDEAHFHPSGAVNKQNVQYWTENNTKQFHAKCDCMVRDFQGWDD